MLISPLKPFTKGKKHNVKPINNFVIPYLNNY